MLLVSMGTFQIVGAQRDVKISRLEPGGRSGSGLIRPALTALTSRSKIAIVHEMNDIAPTSVQMGRLRLVISTLAIEGNLFQR